MKVNTLILCATGTSLNNVIGCLFALKHRKIINENNNNIKRFIGCSSGSLLSLLLCCNIPLNMIYNILNKSDYSKLLNIDDLNNLFDNMGLFDTKNIQKWTEIILLHFNFKKNITFYELYEKTNKILLIKSYNLSRNKEFYISYKNFPNMPIKKAIAMSCCVPFVFKPVIHENELYIDGAVCGSTPLFDKYKNYISVTFENRNILKNNITITEYLSRLVQSTNIKYVEKDKTFYNNKRNIIIDWIKDDNNYNNKPFLDFDITSSDKDKDILNGYNQTINHIDKFIIVNK